MDKKTKKLLVTLASVLVILTTSSSLVNAGTVLATPQQLTPSFEGEGFPESRFGQPPAKVGRTIDESFASRAVDDMERREFGEEGEVIGTSAASPHRKPAALDFTADKSAKKLHRMAPSSKESPQYSYNETIPSQSSIQQVIPKGIQEVGVIAGDLGFFPRTVFVTRDIPVRMFVTGASKNTLCIMMDSFQVRKQVRAQKIEEITFTPNVPGKYRFYCPVNGMEGTLIVRELASATPADAE